MSPDIAAAEVPTLVDLEPPPRQMLDDVLRGLSAPDKRVPPIYFYDQRGSRLFDQICELPEYYLTRAELAILRAHIDEMAELVGPRALLIELGSGSSLKTCIPLAHLHDLAAYVPVDISRDYLIASVGELRRRFPGLEIRPVAADFTQPFEVPTPSRRAWRRLVYFPGSTLGNFDPDPAVRLLANVARIAGPSGAALIGVDLEKDVTTLERAYNDAAGVTARFNLNLLERFNRELGADFDLDSAWHRAVWSPRHHRIEMHLVSGRDQTIHIDRHEIRWRAGEKIHTESSYKYTVERFAELAARAGLSLEKTWYDPRSLFSVHYLVPTRDPAPLAGE